MRVFVAVQPSPRSGASSLSRYIAQSKVDRDREQVDEKGSRPLFSEREDNLTYREADRILNPTSGELEKEDVIHVVISPEPGSFERAGDTDDERKQSLIEAVRNAVLRIARELKVRYLNWIGGLHGNTRTPHGHLAVSRWALDEQTGKLVYIKHLPESLLPRNLEGDDGTKRFSTGKIAEVFASSLSDKRKPVRCIQWQDRNSGTDLSRSVLSPYALMLFAPTADERLVGRWIEAKLTLAREAGQGGRDPEVLAKECTELRGRVAQIDATARAQGAKPTAAYLEPEKLEELVRDHDSALRVKVFSERPQGLQERYVESTNGPRGSGPDEPSILVANESETRAVTVSLSPQTLMRESGPANGMPRNTTKPRQNEVVLPERSTRPKSSRASTPQRERSQKPDRSEETPRVGTKTLTELRSYVLQNQRPAVGEEASHALNATQVHEHSSGQVVRTGGAQPEDRPVQLVRSPPKAQSERAPMDAANLVTTKEPRKEILLSDTELSSLAHIVRFNRLYLERERDILRESTLNEIVQIQLKGDRDRSKAVTAREPLDAMERRVCEAILLDNVYEDVRRERNVPKFRLSDPQQDLLKDRESFQANLMKNSLPDIMELAKEQLTALAPLANPVRVNEYHKYQEEQRALVAVARDREETIANRDHGRTTVETLEKESHSTLIPPLPAKEPASEQALVEKAIELLL